MKKINIFNRNTDLPSYRRMPVSGGIVENRHTAEARCPGIAIAMTCPAGDFSSQGDEKHNVCDASFCIRKNWVPAFAGMTIIVIAALFATPSFADPTPAEVAAQNLAKKTVASKAYVDTKQDMIPAATEDYQSVLVDTDSDGEVGKMQIVTGDYLDDEGLTLEDVANTIPTSGAVWYELDSNWQPKIETGLVEFEDTSNGETYSLPALVSYGTGTNGADGLLGNKIGILSYGLIADPMSDYTNVAMDDYVPTVRAVAFELGAVWSLLNLKQPKLPAAYGGTTGSALLGSTGGQTIDLGADAGAVGQRYITAGGSQPLTQKTGADNVILYINGTKTLAQYQTSNFGATASSTVTKNENYIKGALVSLELLKDVYSALHNEIQNATPTGTPGNVAMYDASTGALGDGVATYSGATAQNPYNATNDAAKIATAAAVETKQTKRVCAGYEPGHENEADYCWLWDFPD